MFSLKYSNEGLCIDLYIYVFREKEEIRLPFLSFQSPGLKVRFMRKTVIPTDPHIPSIKILFPCFREPKGGERELSSCSPKYVKFGWCSICGGGGPLLCEASIGKSNPLCPSNSDPKMTFSLQTFFLQNPIRTRLP